MIGALVLAVVVVSSPAACPASAPWVLPTDEGYVCSAVSYSQEQVEHPKPTTPPRVATPHHRAKHHHVRHHSTRKAHR